MDSSSGGQYVPGTTVPGWTCLQCGVFVPYGVEHTCPSKVSYLYPSDRDLILQIIRLLEEIKVLLGKGGS
jgi:hypothetical protein